MMLHDNPFAVLGAAPGDSRVSLGEKAARAGSPAADEALRLLTQPESRLAAELAWFPKSRQETVQAFVDYADALAEGRAAVVPRVEGLGCALAEANALSALFSAWPTEDSELFVGLCRTIEMLLSRVTADDTLRAINADRAAGGWESLEDASVLSEPLEQRLRVLCEPVKQGMDKLGKNASAAMLDRLLETGSFDVRGCVIRTACDSYKSKISTEAGALKGRIITEAGNRMSHAEISKTDVQCVQNLVRKWRSLCEPLFKASAADNGEAWIICKLMHSMVVDYLNKAKPTQKSHLVIINPVKATTATVTYQSKGEAVRTALETIDWLRDSFPEQTDLLPQLEGDRRILQDMQRKEKEMLDRAEMEAHAKYGW